MNERPLLKRQNVSQGSCVRGIPEAGRFLGFSVLCRKGWEWGTGKEEGGCEMVEI